MTLCCQCFSMTLSINPDFELDLQEFAWSDLCLSWLSLSLHGNNEQLLFIQHKINSSIRWPYWLDLWWRPPSYFPSWIWRLRGGNIHERGRSLREARSQRDWGASPSHTTTFSWELTGVPWEFHYSLQEGSTLSDLQWGTTYGLQHLQSYHYWRPIF